MHSELVPQSMSELSCWSIKQVVKWGRGAQPVLLRHGCLTAKLYTSCPSAFYSDSLTDYGSGLGNLTMCLLTFLNSFLDPFNVYSFVVL